MPASVSKIGHIVLKVEDLDSALALVAANPPNSGPGSL
jgi:hypothetical protein